MNLQFIHTPTNTHKKFFDIFHKIIFIILHQENHFSSPLFLKKKYLSLSIQLGRNLSRFAPHRNLING